MLTALGIIALIILGAALAVVLLVQASVIRHPPFIPVPAEVLSEIVKALNIEPGSVVCDLGCGDARVLAAGFQSEPSASYIGVEKGLYPWWLAQRRIARLGRDLPVKVIRGDFRESDLSGVDRLFLYLFPDVMDSLLPKLAKELKKGCRVVSCDYGFSGRQPAAVIDLSRSGPGLRGKRLLVYGF